MYINTAAQKHAHSHRLVICFVYLHCDNRVTYGDPFRSVKELPIWIADVVGDRLYIYFCLCMHCVCMCMHVVCVCTSFGYSRYSSSHWQVKAQTSYRTTEDSKSAAFKSIFWNTNWKLYKITHSHCHSDKLFQIHICGSRRAVSASMNLHSFRRTTVQLLQCVFILFHLNASHICSVEGDISC